MSQAASSLVGAIARLRAGASVGPAIAPRAATAHKAAPWLWFAVGLCAVASGIAGCRRDATAPIETKTLFPDAGTTAPVAVASAQGSVVRAEQLTETEPNDSADRAMSVSSLAVVAATLQSASVEPAAAPAKLSTKGKGTKAAAPKLVVVDQDWYRLPAVGPGLVMQIELRSAPPCAELELYDDSGTKLLRKARTVRGVRPVMPNMGMAAGASLARVVCRAEAAKAGATDDKPTPGGPYEFAVFARPAKPDEEVEPNDVPGPHVATLKLGVPLQATMAPEGDIDLFTLDATGTEPGMAVVLNVTGAPEVDWELVLTDIATGKPWLRRLPARGQGVLIPNLDLGQLTAGAVLQIRAIKGQAPDSPYAVSLQPYLPPGCSRQADCPDQIPKEREPNDFAEHPWPVAWTAAPMLLSGLLSGARDVDQIAVSIAAGSVAAATVFAPSSVALSVSVGGAAPLTISAGGQLVVPGLPGSAQPLLVTVRAAKEGDAAASEAWRLELHPELAVAWEHEDGDETAQAKLWGPLAALIAVVGDASFTHGGWQRRGVLWPADDRDAFGLDLRHAVGATGLELQCAGDGAPGLFCAVQDVQGHDLVRISAGVATAEPTRIALAVLPGALRVVVEARPPRPSLHAYAVRLRIAPEAANLPTAATSSESGRP